MSITTRHRSDKRASDRRSEGRHPEELKAAVRMRGTTLAALSRAGGLTSAACSQALRRRWPRAEQLIADFLGVPVEELFADRYPRSKERSS